MILPIKPFVEEKLGEKGYFEKSDIEEYFTELAKTLDPTVWTELTFDMLKLETLLKDAFDDVLIGRDRGGDGGMGVGV